jgi:PAS domain S-box-containing protein
MEVESRASTSYFATIFRLAPSIIALTRFSDGIFLDINDAGLKSLGYDKSEVIGRTSVELNIWVDLQARAKLFQQLEQTGKAHIQHHVFRTKSGELREGTFSTELIDINGEKCILGVVVDLTEQRRTERTLNELNRTLEEQTKALQAREELLSICVKNVPAGLAMLDCDMRYVQVSDRWCSDYVADRSQILGRSHYEVLPDIPARWKQIHRRALQGETLRAEEDRWDRADGTLWVRWEIRPWYRADGVQGGILIFAEDITRYKHMEDAILGMSQKLVESQEQERARIGRELHDDINQRLAMVAIEVDKLGSETPKSAPERKRRLADLHTQLTQISSGVQSLSHQLHPPNLRYLGTAAAMRNFCRDFAAHQRVEIDFMADEIPQPISHPVSLGLYRVLQEAVHNAVKHSGTRHVEVRLGYSAQNLHLTISDRGKGFDPNAAMRTNGLGLVSMRERVRLINATIAIESQPGRGTTIQVDIPSHVLANY